MSPGAKGRTRRRAVQVAGLVLLVPLGGLAFQTLTQQLDARRYPPPGEIIDIGGYSLHLHCQGSGSPTVVLDAGMGDNALHWVRVQPAVAALTRVCSYDRAGLGWSDPGPEPRTSGRIADELRTLLQRAGIDAPYVLVGHSYGAFDARIFAARHSDEIAGVVLVDAADPEYWRSNEGRARAAAGADERRRQMWLARFGLARVYGTLLTWGVGPAPGAIRGFLNRVPPEIGRAQVALWSRSVYYATVAAQWDSMAESAAAVLGADDLGDLPLIIVTAANNQTSAQRGMAALSTRGSQIIAERSGHDVHVERPEIVIRSILSVVQQARAQAGNGVVRRH